ncbi:MAG: hypothetical protein QW374_06725 [Candidatus Bathyarchaeia archaeon]|nr:hypothetical protein [Candidatus Bathyarchaeota archaeon]
MRFRYILIYLRIIALFVTLIVKLLWMMLILELSIRRAGRGFEEQVMGYGVSKIYARRISATYRNVMRRGVMDMFRKSPGGSVWVKWGSAIF